MSREVIGVLIKGSSDLYDRSCNAAGFLDRCGAVAWHWPGHDGAHRAQRHSRHVRGQRLATMRVFFNVTSLISIVLSGFASKAIWFATEAHCGWPAHVSNRGPGASLSESLGGVQCFSCL